MTEGDWKKEPDCVRPLHEEKLIESGGYTIAQWSPDENHRGGPTEVHLVIEIPDTGGVGVSMRIKTRRGADRLIETLTKHRDLVWPLQ